jgi:hypothetical protein
LVENLVSWRKSCVGDDETWYIVDRSSMRELWMVEGLSAGEEANEVRFIISLPSSGMACTIRAC